MGEPDRGVPACRSFGSADSPDARDAILRTGVAPRHRRRVHRPGICHPHAAPPPDGKDRALSNQATQSWTDAPGGPGVSPTWASSDKDFVTTALSGARFWATIGHGMLNECYWPSTGEPRTRDLTFYLVGEGGWVDLKRVCRYTMSRPGPVVPLVTVTHTGALGDEDYALALEFLPDTERDAMLIRYEVTGPFRLVVIAAPHLDGEGADATAWFTADGTLSAEGGSGGASLALGCSCGFENASVGFVGSSDGWQDLDRNGRLTFAYNRAKGGNVAMTGQTGGPKGVLALACATTPIGARTLVRSLLVEALDDVRDRFLASWASWATALDDYDAGVWEAHHEDLPERLKVAALTSATVMKAHEDSDYPGALVASLSTPWGASTNRMGGYHLVWPRDTVLSAFAFLALGHRLDASRILGHLMATQDEDGHWAQNAYPSGEPFWTGIQLDETGLPILLAAKLRELGLPDLDGTGPMVRRAVRFIAAEGPSTEQGRWEENAGINPFTLAVTIAALVAAAPWLEDEGERAEALDLADDWCARIEDWCYVTASRWTDTCGVDGHYIRVAPPGEGKEGTVQLQNRGGQTIPARDLVAMEFSYLVRLGLRRADDPRVANTIRVVDAILTTQTPSGLLYHRYNEDGYGETADGGPFVEAGIGRGWPLLVGERGHLAQAAGEDPAAYLMTMLACASEGGLLPEQVWDSEPVAGRSLKPGRPSGSAMPLLWAHAELVKLIAARREGRPIELLDCVRDRYAKPRVPGAVRWRDGAPLAALPDGRDLVIEAAASFTLRLDPGGDAPGATREAEAGPFGLWRVRIPAGELAGKGTLRFQRRFSDGWETAEHAVTLGVPQAGAADAGAVGAAASG